MIYRVYWPTVSGNTMVQDFAEEREANLFANEMINRISASQFYTFNSWRMVHVQKLEA